MKDDSRVLLDCSLAALRYAIGALTRFIQPEVVKILAYCIDAIPGLIEDEENPRSSEESQASFLIFILQFLVSKQVSQFVMGLEEQIKRLKNLQRR